mmetsp:Transcript_15571/g.35718  ORF Transcript_15571/g.35718 Transcript_15571/m.35718 type:complete len:759 (+) Transcript_15571:58-2334(+)
MVSMVPMHEDLWPSPRTFSRKVSTVVPASEDVAAFAEAPADIIRELIKGNQRFLANTPVNSNCESQAAPMELLMEDPYHPVAQKAVVIACAQLDIPIDNIFDACPGELQSINVMNNACCEHDGVLGSVDFALSGKAPAPVVIVLGNSHSEPLQAALRCAMEEQGIHGAPTSCQKLSFVEEGGLHLVKELLPACQDALLQMPNAPFAVLTEVATKLNVWHTVQTLLTMSATIAGLAAEGSLEIHGAYINSETGRVQMLGEHPSKVKLLQAKPPTEEVRTDSSPPVPAEEALAALIAGNSRYSSKKGLLRSMDSACLQHLMEHLQLSEGGQNPIAAVLGCADSRAPVELLFDMRPGDLFVLRTAGNTIACAKGSLIGSAEYAIANLHTKLIVVTGHTKCGAVTQAVKAVRAKSDLKQVPGSIGDVLATIVDAAHEAVEQLPDATLAEQVTLATKLNVFNAVKRLISFSDLVKDAVVRMDVQIHGAFYDIFSGKVEFLGQHPELQQIVGQSMPIYTWKVQHYVYNPVPMGADAQKVIEDLRMGNMNFVSGCQPSWRRTVRSLAEPSAMIIYGTEVRVSAQRLFDTAPGALLAQRSLGNIVGSTGGTLFSSIEYAVARFLPKVLIVLGYSGSPIVKYGIEQVQGTSEIPPLAMRTVLDRISVSSVRALQQVGSGSKTACITAAGSDMKVMRLAVEFNVLYAIERLILTSPLIRRAMNENIEIHGAILDHVTGSVEFMGAHPMAKELVELGEMQARARYPLQI